MTDSSTLRCRVLIAHAASETRYHLADLLRNEGYEPVEVDEGKAALQALAQGAVDVALLDLLLPGRGALEILPEARQLSGSLAIIVTGLLSAGPVQQIIGLYGADGYLTLPASRDDLLTAIQRARRKWPPPANDVSATERKEPPPPPPVEPSITASSSAGQATDGATVLLVEDHAHIRFLVRELLVQSGYVVLEAADGGEAMRVCERHSGPIDLLLTDVLMPRMPGPQLFERLAASRPGLKVLYLTGLPATDLTDRGLLKEDAPLVQKPFVPTALLEKVSEVLSTPATSSE
jgi:CheY-like chemotaxis protein